MARAKAEPVWEMTAAEYNQHVRESKLEAAFQAEVIELAQRCGWGLVYHTGDSRRSHRGWPDLVLVREPEALFWEVKRGGGKHTPETPEQRAWIAALQACGFEARFVYPKDWESYIEPRLTQPALMLKGFTDQMRGGTRINFADDYRRRVERMAADIVDDVRASHPVTPRGPRGRAG